MNVTESTACKGFLLLAILAPTVGCAGKKIDSPSISPVAVELSPSSPALNSGATQQFTAMVLGSSNQSVTWGVDSAVAGNSNTGSITANGLYTASQRAGTHTITATGVADSSKSATATVIVQGSVSISPSIVGLSPGGTQQFTATVVGANNPVIAWSVDGLDGGNSSVGTIDAQGQLHGTIAGWKPHGWRHRREFEYRGHCFC